MIGDRDGLFDEGWRDATDDGRRLYHILLAVVVMVIAITGCYETLSSLFYGTPSMPQWAAILLLVCAFAGLVQIVALAIHEAPYLKFAGLTAERVVAGGIMGSVILFGLGVLFARFSEASYNESRATAIERLEYALPGSLLVLGSLGFVVTLAAGLLYAVVPERKRCIPKVLVLDKFGLDDLMQPLALDDDAIDELLVPVLRLQIPNGKTLDVKSMAAPYGVAQAGDIGEAVLRGDKLIEFRRTSHHPELLPTGPSSYL